MEDRQIIIDNIKRQAEAFLLDANEFYPFGVYISNGREIVPVGAYIEDENDNPSSIELIKILEKSFKHRIEMDIAIIAAIAIDGSIEENGYSQDVMEVRIFEKSTMSVEHIKYRINERSIEFY